MDKVTHILSFKQCSSEEVLNRYCKDLEDCGGEVIKKNIKEEGAIGFISVTMDERDEVNFWLKFKNADSYEFMD